jgi:CBS domain-containing protein
MKVQEIMTTAPETCAPSTNLAAAVERLWRANCGALPIVDPHGKLVGIVTDRDICIALGTRNRAASAITADTVMTRILETCQPEEDITQALRKMKERRVRRLPVVDEQDELVGILSLNDILLSTGQGARAVKPALVLETLRAISTHDVPMVVVAAKADAA